MAMAASKSDPFFHMFLLDNFDSSAGPSMSAHVWSRMPFDVLEKVLLRLPLASQARFRAVSKAARWLLSSKRFQLESAKIGVSCGRLPICGLVRSDELSEEGVDVLSELQVPYRVHKLSLSFLPAEFRVLEGTYSCRLRFGKGVLFFAKPLLNRRQLCVGHRICVVNPVNQTWRQLPDLVVKYVANGLPPFEPLKEVSLMGEEDEGFQVWVRHCVKTTSRRGDPLHTYVSVYSSRRHAWKSKFITYDFPDDQITLAEADVVVGNEYAYALRYDIRNDIKAELFRARTGKHVRTMAPPPFNVDEFELGLVQLEQGECMVAVPCFEGTCKILGLPQHTSKNWDVVSVLPYALALKMTPGIDSDWEEDEYIDIGATFYAGAKQLPPHSWAHDSQVVGTFLVVTSFVNERWHVVVYNFLLDTWKIVLSPFSGGDEHETLPLWEKVLDSSYYRHPCDKGQGIVYLEPRPRFRVGMADCPPESAVAQDGLQV